MGFEKILKTVADRRQRNDWSSINPPVLSLKITNSPLWNDPDHSLDFSSFTRQPSTTGGAVVTFMGIKLLRTKDNLNSNQALQAFIRRMWNIHVLKCTWLCDYFLSAALWRLWPPVPQLALLWVITAKCHFWRAPDSFYWLQHSFTPSLCFSD